jgi:hypothetical protein
MELGSASRTAAFPLKAEVAAHRVDRQLATETDGSARDVFSDGRAFADQDRAHLRRMPKANIGLPSGRGGVSFARS